MMSTRRRQRAKRRKTAESAACRVTLPGDLVSEVLLRLPARSLARLRSTCRFWNAEISSRVFQERHHALAAAKFAFLKYAPPHILPLRIMGREIPARLAGCRGCPTVIGSKACRGLVLVGRPCAAYYVCNPTTGETWRLPSSHKLHYVAGIGFHAPAREFKVVQIIDLQPDGLKATVLTVGDPRGWRAPAAAGNRASFVGLTLTDDAKIDKHMQPVFAGGCLHWCFRTTTEYLDKPHGIIVFSLADESFRLVPQLPFSTVDLVQYEGQQQHRRQIWRGSGMRTESDGRVAMPVGKTLAELDGRLCMVRDLRHRTDVGSLLFEIWKLQDYETGGWSLDYRIDLTPMGRMAERLTAPWLVVPLRYLDGGGSPSPAEKRKLLLATTVHEAHIYDPESGTLRTVASTAVGGDAGEEEDDYSVRLLLYQESLVRFPGMKKSKSKSRIRFRQLEQL